jgi:hypothetical protein
MVGTARDVVDGEDEVVAGAVVVGSETTAWSLPDPT